ncbi:MAG: uracil-DNA glycosylase family protein [Alkalispirochaetaceae bacterium]
MSSSVARQLLSESRRLSHALAPLRFSPPWVYNTFEYAWPGWEAYVNRWITGPRRLIFLGMNPGPWGMAQTGVPFGEVAAVREWIGLSPAIGKPAREHPRRRIEGLNCSRSEVSGRRLWGFFARRFPSPEAFFRQAAVINYCPLVFMAESGRNITPDKLPGAERQELFHRCDAHLRRYIELLEPDHLVGVGRFAESCLSRVAPESSRVHRILHPSPASPAANRDWAGTVTESLRELLEGSSLLPENED